jgi:hypothetical protein
MDFVFMHENGRMNLLKLFLEGGRENDGDTPPSN